MGGKKSRLVSGIWSHILQTKQFGKMDTKLCVSLKRMDKKQSDFKSLNKVMAMRHCFNDFNNRKVTMYQ
jgi:hypothetical protein